MILIKGITKELQRLTQVRFWNAYNGFECTNKGILKINKIWNNVAKLRKGKEFVEYFVYGWSNKDPMKAIGSAKGEEETW